MFRYLIAPLLLFLIVSCNNDDEAATAVPPRLLAEVAPENDAEIRAFLETHFYNYEEFETPPADFDFKIRIDTIAGANADKIPLINQVESKTVTVSSFEFGLSEDEDDIPHTVYYLTVREGDDGNGVMPSVADSVFVRYEGMTLDLEAFDGAFEIPVWFDLARVQAPLAGFRGFAEGMDNLMAGGAAVVNPDGTFTVEEYGIGMMFFPSGLGGFNNVTPEIPQYSPLLFTVDLFTVNPTDHDGDGIPSIEEDLNNNGYLFDDNTDIESELDAGAQLAADFQDLDDDDDGIRTRDEINADGSFRDSDGDGIPDHRDPDS